MYVLFFEERKFSHLKCFFFFSRKFLAELLSLFYVKDEVRSKLTVFMGPSFIFFFYGTFIYLFFLQPSKTIEIVLRVKF